MERYHSPSIDFYCRQSKTTKDGTAPIEMGINVNGVRRFINTPMKAKPSEFNRKRRPRELQEYIDNLRQRFNTIICDMLRAGEELNVSDLRDYMRGGGFKAYSVGDMLDGFLKQKRKECDNGEITEGQYKKYDYSANVLLRYVERESPVTALTPALVRDIYTDLKAKYEPATTNGYMTRLKAFFRYAQDNGKLNINPMQGIKIIKPVYNIELITDDDFNKILGFHSDIQRLMKVRDMFIFACGSGLGYKDCTLLKPEDFKTIEGRLCIVKNRAKTGKQFVSVLLPCAVHIAKKHNYDFSALMMSNQKVNAYCKEIQDLCGITSVESLHFYLGRHYYGNHLVNLGVREEIVAKAMGHTSRILMKHYAKLSDVTTVKEIGEVI